VIRMLPVAIAVLGTEATTHGRLRWLVRAAWARIYCLALIVVQESRLPQTDTVLLVTNTTVGPSVFAFGITAAPLANGYARWYRAQLGAASPSMESGPAEHQAREPRGAVRGADPGWTTGHARPAPGAEISAERPDRR
jgi:sodium/hydrogen antiporter